MRLKLWASSLKHRRVLLMCDELQHPCRCNRYPSTRTSICYIRQCNLIQKPLIHALRTYIHSISKSIWSVYGPAGRKGLICSTTSNQRVDTRPIHVKFIYFYYQCAKSAKSMPRRKLFPDESSGGQPFTARALLNEAEFSYIRYVPAALELKLMLLVNIKLLYVQTMLSLLWGHGVRLSLV
jgi:hypothetical protein